MLGVLEAKVETYKASHSSCSLSEKYRGDECRCCSTVQLLSVNFDNICFTTSLEKYDCPFVPLNVTLVIFRYCLCYEV